MIKNIYTANASLLTKDGRIMLRGFSIADPFRLRNKNKINMAEIIFRLKHVGANVIRVPVQPDLWQTVPGFLDNYITEIIELCLENDMYCILDWHAIGNPVTGETRMKDKFVEKDGKKYYTYESSFSVAKKFWQEASKKYRDYSNVIFEIFNEPAPGEKDLPERGLSALRWSEWRELIHELIGVIRDNSDNLILVGPPRWAYDLSLVSENPILGENIAYSIHPYPIHKDWKENFEKISGKYPILVTEWAFKENTHEDFLRATESDYGTPIFNYMEENGINWVAWCYDFEWGPKILEGLFEENKLTKWGDFIVRKIMTVTGADKNI